MRTMIVQSLVLLAAMFASSFGLAQQVWIDVRGDEEYNKDHIDGDTHIPLATIDTEALAAQYGKDAEIMLYCRSGNRAGQAKVLLEAAGFSKVTNAGSITEVRELRQLAEGNASPTR